MKTKDDFEDFYENQDPWGEQQRVEKIHYKKILKAFLDDTKYFPIIEVGCGEGVHYNKIYRNILLSEYKGYDISKNAIDRAQNNSGHNLKLKNADFEQGDFDTCILYASKSNENKLNIIVLETLYYLSDDEIYQFLKALVETKKNITLFCSSLNEKKLNGREYLTVDKMKCIAANIKNVNLVSYYPISVKKKSLAYPVWLLMTVFNVKRCTVGYSSLSSTSAARNNIFKLEINP